MTAVFANFASSTLGAAITSGATSLTVRSGTGDLFPSPIGLEFFYLVLENRTSTGTTREIVKVTARTSNTMTVERAQEGTSAAAFPRGTTAALRITAAGLESLRSSTVDDWDVPGNLTVGGNATVTGNIVLNGTVAVEDSIIVGASASVAGAATVGSLFTIGNVTVSGDLLLNGVLATDGGVVVDGGVTITDGLNVQANLDVTGNATIGGTLSVTEIAIDGLAIVDEADISGTEESQPFPSGKIMKMGVATTAGATGAVTYPDGTVTVTFATPFPTECTGVLLTVKGGTLSGGTTGSIILQASSLSASSFKIGSFRVSDGSYSGNVTVSWFAWGK